MLYDSVKPLKVCEFPNLKRGIGVLVTDPFEHRGMNAKYADVEMKTPVLNTATFGRCVPFEQWRDKALEDTRLILARLDAAIAELQEHRDRLARELPTLTDSGEQLPLICKDQA